MVLTHPTDNNSIGKDIKRFRELTLNEVVNFFEKHGLTAKIKRYSNDAIIIEGCWK